MEKEQVLKELEESKTELIKNSKNPYIVRKILNGLLELLSKDKNKHIKSEYNIIDGANEILDYWIDSKRNILEEKVNEFIKKDLDEVIFFTSCTNEKNKNLTNLK